MGVNDKMNELAAIMGMCNLKRHCIAIEGSCRVCERYRDNSGNIPGIIFLNSESAESANYTYFSVIVKK